MCPPWRSSDEFGVVVDSEKARRLSQRVVVTAATVGRLRLAPSAAARAKSVRALKFCAESSRPQTGHRTICTDGHSRLVDCTLLPVTVSLPACADCISDLVGWLFSGTSVVIKRLPVFGCHQRNINTQMENPDTERCSCFTDMACSINVKQTTLQCQFFLGLPSYQQNVKIIHLSCQTNRHFLKVVRCSVLLCQLRYSP